MPNAVIVDALRTPLGRRNGKLKDEHPVDLAAHVLRDDRRAQRRRPRPRRRRDHGLRHAGRRAGHQHRPQRRARRRLPRDDGRHHHRPPVRFVAAGRALRGAGRDGRRVRRRDRGRRREHDPGADGRVGRRRQVRLPVRSDDDGPLPQPRPAGHLGRADLREVGHQPRGERRVLGASRTSVPRRPREEGRFDREILPIDDHDRRRRRDDDAATRASGPTRRSRRSPSSSPRSRKTVWSPPPTRRRSPTARPRCSS